MHHFAGGVTSGSPASLATADSDSLTVAFAATPPATTMQLKEAIPRVPSPSFSTSPAHSTARLVRSSRCFTAAFWNEAAMSAFVLCLASTASSDMPASVSTRACSGRGTCPGAHTAVNAASPSGTPRSRSTARRTAVFSPA